MISPYGMGGLKAPHIISFIRSLKCTWVKRYTSGINANWKIFFDVYLKDYGGEFLFNCNFRCEDIKTSNTFINHVCSAWSYYNYKNSNMNVLNEIIWNNSAIKINNKIVYYKFMYQKGVLRVKELFDGNLEPLDFDSFRRKHLLRIFPFTIFHGLISAIPASWRSEINSSVRLPVPNADSQITSIHNTSFLSRRICCKLIIPVVSPPKAIVKWASEFQLDSCQWESIFRTPFASLRETKVQYFQFRFLHRILGTNYLLHHMQLKNSSLCTFCNLSDETIDHLFWACNITSNFLLDVEQSIFGNQFNLSKQDLFFGYQLICKHPFNFLIFHLKYYIFHKKLDSSVPTLNEFLHKFKFLLKIENTISNNESTCNKITSAEFESAFSNCPFLFTQFIVVVFAPPSSFSLCYHRIF